MLDEGQKLMSGKDLMVFKTNMQKQKRVSKRDRLNVVFGSKDDGNVRFGDDHESKTPKRQNMNRSTTAASKPIVEKRNSVLNSSMNARSSITAKNVSQIKGIDVVYEKTAQTPKREDLKDRLTFKQRKQQMSHQKKLSIDSNANQEEKSQQRHK